MMTRRTYTRPALTLLHCGEAVMQRQSFYSGEAESKRRMVLAEEEEEEEEAFWVEQKASPEYFGYQPYGRFTPFGE